MLCCSLQMLECGIREENTLMKIESNLEYQVYQERIWIIVPSYLGLGLLQEFW